MNREAMRAMVEAQKILHACEDKGADPDLIEELLSLLDDAVDALHAEAKPVQANNRTVAEVARVLRRPEWIVREQFDDAVEAICARVAQSP